MRERIETQKLDRGYSGTAKSIDKMHELAAAGKLDPTIRNIATWIRLRVPQDKRSRSRELADAVFWWVKKHGVFMRDPFQVERIEHPIASALPVIAAKKSGAYKGPGIFAGDCDLYSVWMAALAGQLGYQYGFETIKVDPGRPDEFSHVYTVLRIGGKWVPYDPSSTGAKPGWRPPSPPNKRKVWAEKPIEEVVGMSGMNGTGAGMGLTEKEIEAGGYYPEDWFYAVPKVQDYYFDPEEDGVLPPIDSIEPGNMDLNVPPEAAMNRADLVQPADTGLRREPPPPASARPLMNDYGTYYPRPHYTGKRPYINKQDPYPPGWPWRMQVVRTGQLDPMVAPYAVGDGSGAAPGVIAEPGMGDYQTYMTPEAAARARRVQPQRETYLTTRGAEAAMGSLEDVMRAAIQYPPDRFPLPPGGLMSGLGQEAESVKKDTDDALDKILGLFPEIGKLVIDKKRTEYAERIGRATGRVADKAEADIWTSAGIPKPTALSTGVIAAGVAAAALFAYFTFVQGKPRPARARYRRTTRRRRRR